jgi:hypothetical protein
MIDDTRGADVTMGRASLQTTLLLEVCEPLGTQLVNTNVCLDNWCNMFPRDVTGQNELKVTALKIKLCC